MERPRVDWVKLRRKSATVRRALDALWRDAEALLADPDRDAISAAEVLTREVAAWEEVSGHIAKRCRESLGSLEPEKQRQIEGFEQQLSRRLNELGHEVRGEAGLLIVDGIVHIEIDLEKLRISVNGAPCVRLGVEAVAAKAEEAVQRLRRTITPSRKMLEQLLTAYEQAVKATNKQSGSQAEMSAVMLQLVMLRQSPAFRANPEGRLFRDYPRELFRADLFTLLATGQADVKGKRLRCASGSDTVGAVFMMVPALGRAAHLGRIWFEPAEQ